MDENDIVENIQDYIRYTDNVPKTLQGLHMIREELDSYILTLESMLQVDNQDAEENTKKG